MVYKKIIVSCIFLITTASHAAISNLVAQSLQFVRTYPKATIAGIVALAHLNRYTAKESHFADKIPTGPIDFTDREPRALLLEPLAYIDSLLARSGYCVGSCLNKLDSMSGNRLSALLRFDDNYLIGQPPKIVAYKESVDKDGSKLLIPISTPARGVIGYIDKHLGQFANIAAFLAAAPNAWKNFQAVVE